MALADAIERRHDPDPGSVRTIRRLLSDGCASPLYNDQLHISELRATVHYLRQALNHPRRRPPASAPIHHHHTGVHMSHLKHTPVLLTALLVAGVLGAGANWALASAAAPSPTGTDGRVSGCYDSSGGGALRVVPSGSTCGTDTPLSWVGTTPNAVVFHDGTLLHASGVSKITHTAGSGLYDVYFTNPNAGACAQVASPVDQGAVIAYGGVVASNVVQVQTTTLAGARTDRTFQLILAC